MAPLTGEGTVPSRPPGRPGPPDPSGGPDEPPGPLVWTLPEPPGRPAATLSRAAILGAALAVADAEGAAALTMRRVAADLGSSTPMSLYRYVGSKDGLVDLMIDAVYGEVARPPAPSGDWRADLEALTLDTWAVIRRHLWFGQLVHTRPPFGPNALAYLDYRFAALAAPGLRAPGPSASGLSADHMTRITAAVDSHLIGSALQLAEESRMRRRTGLATDEQLAAAAAPVLAPVLADGRYPALAAWLAGRTTPGPPPDQFADTLACLLDGIAARLP
jgi:AcrR family transcriptional regulator